MQSCRDLTDHRFAVQRIDDAVWRRATSVNLAIDYLTGFEQPVRSFLARHPELEAVIGDLSRPNLKRYAAEGMAESLVFLVLMMTGACNADCPICFTDRRRKRGELTPDERDPLLRQARQLGARFVYVPGEGEPTIDAGFWQLLHTCREIGLQAVIFTNGLVLSDPRSCQRYWKMDPESAVQKLLEYPVSFYFKLWSTRPELVGEMMNIRADKYHYGDYEGTPVPRGLVHLLDSFPRERVGIEVVVERRNADEVVDTIVPFAERHGLARIVEMIQHNGRIFGDSSYDPTPEQAEAASPFLSPTSCTVATCKAVVTSRGYLSPRIAVLEHQIPGTPVDVRSGQLFHLLHMTPYIVERRYDLRCLCEELPLELAGAGDRILVRTDNVTPPSLLQVTASQPAGPAATNGPEDGREPVPAGPAAPPAAGRFRPDSTVAALLGGERPSGDLVRLGGRVRQPREGRFELSDDGQRVQVELSEGQRCPLEAAWVGVRGAWDGEESRLVSARLEFVREPDVAIAEAAAWGLPEARFVAEPERLGAVRTRAELLRWMRSFLEARGYLEVHTPFVHAAAECGMVNQVATASIDGRPAYLRTDPEEYLKRYLTAGLEAVYEIASNFRLDERDADHLREFTSVECYRRFMGLDEAVALGTELVTGAMLALRGSTVTQLHGQAVDLTPPIPVQSFSELVKAHTGLDPSDYPTAESLAEVVRRRGWWQGTGGRADGHRRTWLEWLMSNQVLPNLRHVTFVTQFPAEMAVNAVLSDSDAGVSQRAELYLPGGFELANLYENLTEPRALRERCEERLAHRLDCGLLRVELDEGLLGSAELGMPPMGGLALGIDRLLLLVLGEGRVGDGLLFADEGVPGERITYEPDPVMVAAVPEVQGCGPSCACAARAAGAASPAGCGPGCGCDGRPHT